MGLNMNLLGAFVAGAAIVFGLQFASEPGSLLYCLLFFVAVAQGPITVMAAADIAHGTWHAPYKQAMFSVRHMNLFLAMLYGVFIAVGGLELYDWTQHETHLIWLQEPFFMFRNVALLLLSWLIANIYCKQSAEDRPKKVMWAIIWVFTFVANQTVVAVDWVMSLLFPWISTLFGVYFFVEAFYAGLAFAGIYTFFKHQTMLDAVGEKRLKKTQMDIMTMFFGFSIFWAYQFFSQFIVIWYGNIPEEVHFLWNMQQMYGNWIFMVLVILFVIPFITMLFRSVKGNPRLVMMIGFLVWGGIMLERVFFLGPFMTINPIVTGATFVVMAGIFYWVVRNGQDLEISALQ